MSLHVSTGVDVIEIERIQSALSRFGERFLRRVYTEREVSYCRGKAERLAGRFAGKEAVSKALGVGIRTLRWRDIEILPDQRGKPQIHLYGKAAAIAERRGLSGWDISITHSRSDAIVMVVAWGQKAE